MLGSTKHAAGPGLARSRGNWNFITVRDTTGQPDFAADRAVSGDPLTSRRRRWTKANEGHESDNRSRDRDPGSWSCRARVVLRGVGVIRRSSSMSPARPRAPNLAEYLTAEDCCRALTEGPEQSVGDRAVRTNVRLAGHVGISHDQPRSLGPTLQGVSDPHRRQSLIITSVGGAPRAVAPSHGMARASLSPRDHYCSSLPKTLRTITRP